MTAIIIIRIIRRLLLLMTTREMQRGSSGTENSREKGRQSDLRDQERKGKTPTHAKREGERMQRIRIGRRKALSDLPSLPIEFPEQK